MFQYKCRSCGEWHEGTPSLGADVPVYYENVAPEERDRRCDLGSDDCVIDGKFFFIRGCLQIPVVGEVEPFTWGVWVSISRENYEQFVRYFLVPKRSHVGPFFGWFSSVLPLYSGTLNLKTHVHLRDEGLRPNIELEHTDHPLSLDQRTGITKERLADIFAAVHHDRAE